MKKIFTFFCVFSISTLMLYAQNNKASNKNRPSKVETKDNINFKKEYYLKEDKLKACFVNGEIPSNYPKRSQYHSPESYKEAVINFVHSNQNLMVESKVNKYKKYDNLPVAQKPVLTEQEVRLKKYKRTVPISQEEVQLKESKQQQLLNK